MSMIRSRRRRFGGAALEFALVVPPLLLLTLPIIDFTNYFLMLQQVETAAQSAVRHAARVAPADDPPGVATATARSLLTAALPCCADQATVSSRMVRGRIVRVEIRVPYTSITRFGVIPSDQLVAYGQMILESS